MNDFIVKTTNNKIYIAAHPDTIRNLASILEQLVSVAKSLKQKAEIISNKKRREEIKYYSAVAADNEQQSVEIYELYRLHLNNSCAGSHIKAMHEIKAKYGLLSVDAEYYIAMGKRKLKQKEKEERIKSQCSLF